MNFDKKYAIKAYVLMKKAIKMTEEYLTPSPNDARNDFLLAACKTGNLETVQRAIADGADLNALKYNKMYFDGFPGQYECEGDTYASPLIVAAQYMGARKETSAYQDVIRFLMFHPDIDLSCVVVNDYKEYHKRDNDWHVKGRDRQTLSLHKVLTDKAVLQRLYIPDEGVAFLKSTYALKKALEKQRNAAARSK